eukprot:1140734-Pelagomonas_calceolata.AAC.1
MQPSVFTSTQRAVQTRLHHTRRALKTKGNTPKYGLIFHSSFIGRAKQRNKVSTGLLCHHVHHLRGSGEGSFASAARNNRRGASLGMDDSFAPGAHRAGA